MNIYFWFVFGDFINVVGNVVNGDIVCFFVGDKIVGMFMIGFFLVMMFGLLVVCFVMIVVVKLEKCKVVIGMLVGLVLILFLIGIIEFIEFLFMFLLLVLYGIYVVLIGFFLFIIILFGIYDGFLFSVGVIDYVLNFGIVIKLVLLVGIGLIYVVIYFIVFYFLIKKFDLKIFGCEDDDELVEDGDVLVVGLIGEIYVVVLGGKENLIVIDNCVICLCL